MTDPDRPTADRSVSAASSTGWPTEPDSAAATAPVAAEPPAASTVPPPPVAVEPPAASAVPPPPVAVEPPAASAVPPPPVAVDPLAASAVPPPPVAVDPLAASAVPPPPVAVDPPAASAPVVAPAADPPTVSGAAPARGAAAGLRSAPFLALVLTTLLMAIAASFVWYQVHERSATETARRAALQASRDAARVLFSYDYRTLDKDFAAGRAVTTGHFRQQYADTTSKVVASVAAEKKALVKADVVTAGVVRASPDTVVTIVFVNQVTTSSLTTGPKIDLSRVRMTMSDVGGRWLVANVEAL